MEKPPDEFDREGTTPVLPPADTKRASRAKLRKLKLELQKTRREADAARLDARAAELELQIRQLDHRLRTLDEAGVDETVMRVDQGVTSAVDASPVAKPSDGAELAAAIANWQDVREILDRQGLISDTESEQKKLPHRPDTAVRFDRSHRDVDSDRNSGVDDLLGSVWVESDTCEREPRRRRPGAFYISALFHGMVVLLLAIFTLSTPTPGDQIAIAGSVAETDEISIENLEIETEQLQTTPSEQLPSETQTEISELGELPVVDPLTDAPPSPQIPMIDSMVGRELANAASMSLQSESTATMEFCGVEGGGNHFVYLVDSSASMGDAFASAREELLKSIRLLKPDQRFYVIFFDAEPDYMRLTSPNRDEPRSVYATPANKEAVLRWAVTIKMDRGRAPYDAIPFALDLSPDVIFLLSDGEFPQRIEDMLKELNRVDNLFGDDGPISIIHTIGYHSREGESRMRRIAKQNGGRYRHVPKPK